MELVKNKHDTYGWLTYRHACSSIINQSNPLLHNTLIKEQPVDDYLKSIASKLAWPTFNSTGISAGVRTNRAGRAHLWDKICHDDGYQLSLHVDVIDVLAVPK